jgi:cyanophycinase
LNAHATAGEVAATTRLMLSGGGGMPSSAVLRFCEWAGGSQARILDVTWATGHPDETHADVVATFASCRPTSVEHALRGPFSAATKAAFLDQLHRATAVFFSGGDQSLIMDVLADRELLQELRALYLRGLPFGGTSAGAAIMSPLMITGEGDFSVIDGAAVGTRDGLGLLPGTVVDSHFIVRQRENRLFGLILAHPELYGVGVDEGSVVFVTDGVDAELLAGSQIITVGVLSQEPEGSLRVRLHKGPEKFRLGN